MEPDADRLAYIHKHKTADLMTAPLLAAGHIAGADGEKMKALAGSAHASALPSRLMTICWIWRGTQSCLASRRAWMQNGAR